MTRFVKYKLTSKINNVDYQVIFLGPPDHYPTDISTLSGVTEVEADSDADELPVTKVEEVLKSSLGARRKVRINTGTEENPKSKYASIVIAADKVQDFEIGAEGKTYKGGKISGIVEPLTASFF